MATTLQQQLAVIAANSTQQLDLKAQKARHSKSLLFERQDAASQSFDTIYQICYEGFEELCLLDTRFRPFAKNIFSQQSQLEDRTQMTQQENEELNKILESFLGLVGGRLLLKPAMQATEWVVRRFQVQDYNTECVLLTFLPYHTSHIFPTLLSILPERLPASFRFLHPYVASLKSPPRHAILSAAVSNHQFFNALSTFVVKVAKARHHSAVLLGFWASITAQAVNGVLDGSQSGRDSVRRQREEDLLSRLLPVLQSALSIKGVPELYLGSCMVMTILATKASLTDKVLDAMMEAVANAWTDQTSQDGITCLAVLAEEKQEITLPASTVRAIIENQETIGTLTKIATSQRIEKLTAGILSNLLDGLRSSLDLTTMTTISVLVRTVPLQPPRALTILQHLLLTRSTFVGNKSAAQLLPVLQETLESFGTQAKGIELLQQAAKNTNVDLEDMKIYLGATEFPALHTTETQKRDLVASRPSKEESHEHFNVLLNELPALPRRDFSFVSETAFDGLEVFMTTFDASLLSEDRNSRLLDQPSLKRAQALESPEFLTFLARIWTCNKMPSSRLKALEIATQTLTSVESTTEFDMQALFPYTIAGLSDPQQRVRKAASELWKAIVKLYGNGSKPSTWVGGNIYEENFTTPMKPADANKFATHCIQLEDCVLDGDYVSRSLSSVLSGETAQNHLKGSSLHSVASFMAEHARMTSVLRVKLILLQVIGHLGKTLGDARTKSLLPLVKDWCLMSQEAATAACVRDAVSLNNMDGAIMGSLSRRSVEEIDFLQDTIAGETTSREELIVLAFERLARLLPLLSSTARNSSISFLLDMSLDQAQSRGLRDSSSRALSTLQAAKLPSDALLYLLETLPRASEWQDQPPSAKRQRLSKAGATQIPRNDSEALQKAVRRISVVLDLVEGQKVQQHGDLLKSLFQLLGDLHQLKSITGSELVYIQTTIFSCLLTALESEKSNNDLHVDGSFIRTDLIVDSIRTTSNPQIYNTGLLLISRIASWKPDLVLHSVMPLFTFMSSTLLKQSDEYSAYVADQTIASIVPPLAVSLKKNGRSIVTGAANLLLSFTAAYEHIPLHRRVALFKKLVDILGPDDVLFAIVAMLIAKYSENDQAVLAFIADLIHRFPATTMLIAARQYHDLLFDALKPKRGVSNLLLGLDENPDVADEIAETLMDGLATIMTNARLRRRLAQDLSGEDNIAETLRSRYAALLEATMRLKQDMTPNADLDDSADTLLSAVLGLMPTKDFIESSAQLMQTGSDLTRQQVFDSLEARVVQSRRGDSISQRIFLEVLPNCCVFIQEEQPVATRHAAISCIDQICVKFGKTDRSSVLQAAEQIVGPAALGSNDESLRIVSTLCLASMVEVIGEEIVPVIPNVLSQVLSYLEHSAGEVELQNASFALLSAILDYIPWILSSSHLDSALIFSANLSISQPEQDMSSAQAFGVLASRKIGASQLFASIDRVWKNIITPDAQYKVLEMLQRAIQHNTKSTVTKNSQVLFNVLLQAFGLRWKFRQETTDRSTSLFSFADQIGLEMTLKLNDATFRPLFIRLVEWATDSRSGDEQSHRLLSLYSFSSQLFEQLKSIVTSYASFMLENCTNVLQMTPSDERKKELIDAVLKTLSASFRHDQSDFWQSPAHFDAIAIPLLSQLTHADSRTATEYVIPAITELAGAASSPDHLKVINTTIMSYMRHDDAAVRLAAVKAERSITEKLNFDWLALLPEMLPFISELQEDDDEEVERETLRWVSQIEAVTGESLEGMLA